jgi:hypothetical protein
MVGKFRFEGVSKGEGEYEEVYYNVTLYYQYIESAEV